MRNAVVTIVAGRHAHLAAQRRALRELGPAVDLHVVVALGDDTIAGLLAAEPSPDEPPTVLVELPADDRGLPLATGRNAGARAALGAGAELLIFLDVDCLPGAELVERYTAAARQHPGDLVCGPVTYLPPHDGDWTSTALVDVRDPHPARPDLPPGDTAVGDPDLFWSLSFAVTAATWAAVGGFDERYVGYGAEDTDFGRRARSAGAATRWVGGADAYHQHHPTSSPPIQHVDAVLSNGARFVERWGEWPMRGWLERFAELGLVHPDNGDWVRARPIRLASVPATHPFVDAVRPAAAHEVDRDARSGRNPDPLLSVDGLRAATAVIDVVHVHFGYEQLDPGELEQWVGELDASGVPLVLTVHDLRNPHTVSNSDHEQQLKVLLDAAAEVITLTEGAAAEVAARYGRDAEVLAHPTLVTTAQVQAGAHRDQGGAPVVGLPLGLLRRNVAEPVAVATAALAGARRAGARLTVSVRREVVADERLTGLHALVADAADVDLVVHDRFTDAGLAEFVSAMHVLVLPYRFGTHSGMLELARDLGTTAVVPSCGFYAEQWPATEQYDYDEGSGLNAAGLADAVVRATARPRPAPADRSQRLAEQAGVQARHEVLYRRAMAGR